MGNKYQDIYPSEPLIRSSDELPARAVDLLHGEYFEEEDGRMPKGLFAAHHALISLRQTPRRVENCRGENHRDYQIDEHDVVITPAGLAINLTLDTSSRNSPVRLQELGGRVFARPSEFDKNSIGIVQRQSGQVGTVSSTKPCAGGIR